jgi:hypothetical protein
MAVAGEGAVTSDLICTLSNQPAALWTGRDTLAELRGASLPVSLYELGRSEEFFYESLGGSVKRLTSINGPVKIWFPGTDNTYTASSVVLFDTSTSIAGDKRYAVKFMGVDYNTMNAAEKLPGVRFYAYTQSQAAMPYASKQLEFSLTNDGGGCQNPFPENWVAKRFFFARGNGPNTIAVKVYVINQSDGRLVDAEVGANAYYPGYLVASGTFNNYVDYGHELTLNADGTDNPGSVGFANGIIVKPGYKFLALVTSGTLVGSGTISISTK